MKLRSLVVILMAGSALCQSEDLGVSLGKIPDSTQKRIELAKQLGVSWYRPEPVLLGAPKRSCADCEAATAAGLKLALVIRNSPSEEKASDPVGAEADSYQQRVGFVLHDYKPALLIVESEPDRKDSFAGSPEEYGAEVRLACSVAAQVEVKCADGGISSATMVAVATAQRWSTDKIDAAKFANTVEATRASGREGLKIFGKHASDGKADLDAIVDAAAKYIAKNQAEIDRGRALMKAAEAAGISYTNFHWVELQPDVIPKLVDILHEITKKPLMTDFVGQRTERPFETGEKIRVLREQGVTPIIWNASDSGNGVVGLIDKKGKLRPTADAFKREAARQ